MFSCCNICPFMLCCYHITYRSGLCNDIVPSSTQLSPCCSPALGWWPSCRQSSPPAQLHHPLHLSVLLQLCWVAATYSCPPSLPCSVFTPLRYTAQLRFTLITAPGLNRTQWRRSQGRDTKPAAGQRRTRSGFRILNAFVWYSVHTEEIIILTCTGCGLSFVNVLIFSFRGG